MKKMTEATLDEVAKRFRVLSDPKRLEILCHLGTEELSVSEIVNRTGGSQPNISKHLTLMLSHGILARRREGTSSLYSVVDQSIFGLCDQVCEGIDRSLEKRRDAFR